MKCGNCGSNLDSGWRFCPKCGSGQSRAFDFQDIFSRMRKEMEEMARSMDSDIEALDLSPFFKKARPQGFSIKISSGPGIEPKVEVRTFGDIDKRQIESQLRSLGVKRIAQGPGGAMRTREKPMFPREDRKLRLPEATEEPAANVRRLDGRVVVDLEIPGVKSEKDIEVNELESSVEVKAIAGNRGYFKILTKPEEFSLSRRTFKNGKLQLEFS